MVYIYVCRVSLLAVMGTWTFLMLHMLVLAQAVEASIETNVHWLNSQLVCTIYSNFIFKYHLSAQFQVL